MPQMAPINWMSLYILFSLLFLLMIILNYYMFLYSPKYKPSKIQTKPLNWKW